MFLAATLFSFILQLLVIPKIDAETVAWKIFNVMDISQSDFYEVLSTKMTNSGRDPIYFSTVNGETYYNEDWGIKCYQECITREDTYVVFWYTSVGVYCETYKLKSIEETASIPTFLESQLVRVEKASIKCNN